ncbi:Chorismate mutase / prephenate dehydratase [Syntrophobacter sp. SbD1]|nr:Chorismate mutase / prephenate dehydratase [Syntrophobacter sp. SbD1]
MDENLDNIREEIDGIDSELLGLLNRRMELAIEVGRIKASGGLPLFHPEREQIISRRLSKLNQGPLSEESLRSIYREIFAASRLIQYRLQVAFPGPEWTPSHLASISLFGHSASYMPCGSLEEVFDSFLKGKAHLAVIPIETSLHGGAGHSLDLLYEREVRVISECYLEIAHYLCGNVRDPRDIKRVYGPPHAIEQCRRWLLENAGQAEHSECSSTARAALSAKEDPNGAAICNLYAAQRYGLRILAERIEDVPGNTARFLALGNCSNQPTGDDKTSLLFAVSDRPGSLLAALGALSSTNITRIESRPNKFFSWQYLFYADIEGHREDDNVRAALDSLAKNVTFYKILGSYPKSDPTRPFRIEKEKMRMGRDYSGGGHERG